MKGYAIREMFRGKVEFREGILPEEFNHGKEKRLGIPVGGHAILFDRKNPPEVVGDGRVHEVHPVPIRNRDTQEIIFQVLAKPDRLAEKCKDVLVNLILLRAEGEIGENLCQDGKESLLRLKPGEKLEVNDKTFQNVAGKLEEVSVTTSVAV